MFGKQITGTSASKLYFYIVYWIVYLLFFTVQRYFAMRYILLTTGNQAEDASIWDSLLTNLFFLPVAIAGSHFMINYLIPRYYFNKKFYGFSLLAGLTIILYPLFVYLIRIFFVDVRYPNPQKYNIDNYYAAMLIYVFGLAPLVWYEIARHLKEEHKIMQKLDKDRLEALLKLKETELKLLKSQIQPHFLFNTLNNLYSLALEKSDRAPDLIIRLSDMLSYIIYECKSEKVPLSKEIDFIKNYIELQKVRYDNCDISFSYTCDTDKFIAPMILHTFIDNCFKHGAEKDAGNPWIKIAITSTNGSLFFSAINSINTDENGKAPKSGIGISNTEKRLDLIYRDRHELVLDNSGRKFRVFLKMQL